MRRLRLAHLDTGKAIADLGHRMARDPEAVACEIVSRWGRRLGW